MDDVRNNLEDVDMLVHAVAASSQGRRAVGGGSWKSVEQEAGTF
jgi:hypothetical protein